MALLASGASLARAADASSAARPGSAHQTSVAPVAATQPTISLGRCHYEKKPAHDPQRRLECPSGEVVVAVYEEGVRCCMLEIH